MTALPTLTTRQVLHRLEHLPLLLLLLVATPPAALHAAERPPNRTLAAEQQQQRQRYTGVWALVDNANNLFNVRLSADGQAISTTGTNGVPVGGSSHLAAHQLYEQGRWAPWGNGVRIDYSDGWSDAILTGPAGPTPSVRTTQTSQCTSVPPAAVPGGFP